MEIDFFRSLGYYKVRVVCSEIARANNITGLFNNWIVGDWWLSETFVEILVWVVIWCCGCLDVSLYNNIALWNGEPCGCVDGLATWCLSLWPSGLYCCAEGGDSRYLYTKLHGVTSQKTVIWLPQSYASLNCYYVILSSFTICCTEAVEGYETLQIFPQFYVTYTVRSLAINT